ncbi:transglutaminase-like cysteine peptidase [Sphingomonas xanthus]|uniref:Transglutaminase n=1 Tax=Sphingomonas xanthus TaxID=2594473 RepID=A0A516IR06_9SPHN|nr:transglutaminase-like cysteine peptidase [Sphingomonas xanthus]QDP19348.1 hypothetical protein FMM02_04825 [Sphingomonas xanthus]
MQYSARLAKLALAGLAAAGLATPSLAQVAPAAWRSMSKSEAILGGAPSALSAITARQAGGSAIPALAANASLPAMRPAIQRVESREVSRSQPDVFNSVALLIDRSPLQARWSRVAEERVHGSAAAYAASLRGAGIIAQVEAVNSYVNSRIRFTDDRVQFGVADRWLSPAEALSRGRGDCEDFAIAKRAMLRAAGVAERDLYLVILKDLSRRADHAVLVVRANGRFLVLDNGTDRIVDSSDVTDYRPILTFTTGQSFTHGYRRETIPPVTYAANRFAMPITLTGAPLEPAVGAEELPAVVRETATLIGPIFSL